jgi:hypothetical protein
MSTFATGNRFEGLSLANARTLLETADKETLVSVSFAVDSGDAVVTLKNLADRHPEAQAEISSVIKGLFFKRIEVTVSGKAWFVKAIVDGVYV